MPTNTNMYCTNVLQIQMLCKSWNVHENTLFIWYNNMGIANKKMEIRF